MSIKFAARLTDNVMHPLSMLLGGAPGSPDVTIGGIPAWRGIPAAAAAGLQAQKKASEMRIKVAEAASALASGTPAAPAAKAIEQSLKAAEAAAMSAAIMSCACGADIHLCSTPLLLPPHGPGVVMKGSGSVTINGLPACRQGDEILEAIGTPNKIVRGFPMVTIGD